MTAVEIALPYSKDYLSKAYGIGCVKTLSIIEEEFIPQLLTRLSISEEIKSIFVISNDLQFLKSLQTKKVYSVARSDSSEKITTRESIALMCEQHLDNRPFIMLNALFPLISLKSIQAVNSLMHQKKSNVFLGAKGKVARVQNGTIQPHSECLFWDYGAINGYFSTSKDSGWISYDDYRTIEVLSVRNPEDISDIRQILNVGLS